MALIGNSLEGGNEGVNVTTANSGGVSGTAFTSVGTPTSQSMYRASAAWHGNFGMLVGALSASAPLYDLDDAAPAASFALRFYIRMDSYPSVTDIQFPINFRTLAGSLGRTDFSNTGTIRINGGTYSTSALTLGTWYRIEMQGTGLGAGAGAATLNLQVYVGDNTGTPYITQTLSAQTFASPAQRIRYGKASTSPTTADFNYALDEFAQDIGTSTPIGPASIITPSAGSDQSVNPNDVVTLTGAGAGTWSQTGGSPTVTLTKVNGLVSTFNAPYTVGGTTLTFSYGGDSMDVVVAAAANITAIMNTAEGGADGVSATTGNTGGASGTAFSTVSAGSGGTIAFESTGPYKGAMAYQFTQPTAATVNIVDITGPGAAATFSIRVYLKLLSYPSLTDTAFPISMRSAGSPIGRIDMNTTGQLRIGATATGVYSTVGLALNTWYRVEFYGINWGTANSNATVDVYEGDKTGTPYATASLTAFTTSAQVLVARFGKTSTSVISFMMDDFAVKIGTPIPIGPSAGWPSSASKMFQFF